ncbi:MAG: YciI family protein [Actinomycetota bacterium]|nr:YciI family protein [Actinomycetota bacterium]
MQQCLLAVHMNEDDSPPSAEEMERAYKDVDALNAELQAQGAWVFAGGLEPPSTATVMRAQDDEVIVTDGPFAETKEQLGGFWVIKAPDLDAALEWSKKATVAAGLELVPRSAVTQISINGRVWSHLGDRQAKVERRFHHRRSGLDGPIYDDDVLDALATAVTVVELGRAQPGRRRLTGLVAAEREFSERCCAPWSPS